MSAPSTRFKTNETATIEIYGRPGSTFSKLTNISKTGAMFELIRGDKLPKYGDFIQITVHLSALKKNYVLQGKVVWSNKLQFGVEFIKRESLADAILRGL